jgi:fructokinase
MVCAVGDEKLNLLDKITIPTGDPETTIPEVIRYFQDKKIEALGVGAFGPIDLKVSSESYGCILDSTKLAWRHYPLRKRLIEDLGIPIGLDTDVNAACLGEVAKGTAAGYDPVVYITIGTGIGAGIYVNGRLLHGMLHPEAGHIYLMKHPEDPYSGNCPYHKHCFEDLAAGTAIEKRWGKRAAELADCREVWELESYYIAQALVDYIMILSPELIILGGGVMNQRQLFPLIRDKVRVLMGGYVNTRRMADLDSYIIPASLGGDQGIIGCLRLARQSLES